MAEELPRARPAVAGVTRLISRVIFASLLALVVLLPVPYGGVEPTWVAAFEVAVFLLTSLWAVEGAVSGRWFVRAHLLCAPALALAAYAFLQSVSWRGGAVSFDPYESRLTALLLLALTLSGALLIRYTDTERRLRALVLAAAAPGLVSALFGIVRRAAQRAPDGFVLEHLKPGVGFAQFINHNHFAFLAEMALGLVLGQIAAAKLRAGRLLACAAAALTLWAAVLFSGSRGGLLGTTCALLFVTLFAPHREAPRGEASPNLLRRVWGSVVLRAAAAACILAAVLVAVAWVGGEEAVSRVESARAHFSQEGARRGANTSRSDIWRATWDLFAAHPVAGTGFGGYWIAITETHRASGVLTPQQAHNDYLELLAGGGVLGAGLVALGVVMVARRTRRAMRTGGAFRRAASLGAAAGLCGVAAHSVADFGLHVPANALAAVALMVMAAAEIGPPQRTSRAGEA